MNSSDSNYQKSLTLILAFAVGVLAANVYFAQPILKLLAETLNIRVDAAGLIVMMTQLGYGLGVLFIVPLGDLLANKKLILTMVLVAIVGELGLGFFKETNLFLLSSVFAGMGASTVQILVPYASKLFPAEKRGQVIGALMSGLSIGILLARPTASLFTEYLGPHSIFYFSALLLALLWIILVKILPENKPKNSSATYVQMLATMHKLLLSKPVLQRRSFYQALMFCSFCIFWSTVPLLLMSERFGFTQKEVALFALVGVGGAVFAPQAGRLADRGHSRAATIAVFVMVALGFAMAQLVFFNKYVSLVILALAANILDAGVISHLVLGQRAIFMIDTNNQSRLNGIYLVIVNIGGAIGSVAGAWFFAHGGWVNTMFAGLCLPLMGLCLVLSEKFFSYAETN